MEIKKVDIKNKIMKEQFSELMSYCFQGYTKEAIEADWNSFKDGQEEIIGSFDKGQLVSTVILSYRKMMIDGRVITMHGIGGVATHPIYRSGGVCTSLIKEALKEMYNKGAVFSALAPFSYSFYEKLGWKWCYNNYQYKLSIEAFKFFRGTCSLKILEEKDYEMVEKFYNKSIEALNGACYRERWSTEKKIKNISYGMICYDGEENISGYMLYEIDGSTSCFRVKEIRYKDNEALESLLAYIYRHNGQVKEVILEVKEDDEIIDRLKDPNIHIQILPSMMIRIINVEEALKNYEYEKAGTFYIEVIDEWCSWNNKTFEVCVLETGENKVTQVDSKADIKIDIRQLSQVLMGFRVLKGKNQFKSNKVSTAMFDYF